eukprot:365433-Chlamydomonas_euryale.AAC.8
MFALRQADACARRDARSPQSGLEWRVQGRARSFCGEGDDCADGGVRDQPKPCRMRWMRAVRWEVWRGG